MSRTQESTGRVVGIAISALLGAAFFNIIIGVFGLSPAVVGCALFVAVAIVMCRRPQKDNAPQ
jgi:urea transporter